MRANVHRFARSRERAAGGGRGGALVRKPFIVVSGEAAAAAASAIAIPDARQTAKVNAQLLSPGPAALPFAVPVRRD